MKGWTRLHRPPVKGNGHHIFRANATGHVSLADWSGNCPDTTDDGPLWVLPKGAKVVADFAEGAFGPCALFCVEVVTRDDRNSVVWCDFETIQALDEVVVLHYRTSFRFDELRRQMAWAVDRLATEAV